MTNDIVKSLILSLIILTFHKTVADNGFEKIFSVFSSQKSGALVKPAICYTEIPTEELVKRLKPGTVLESNGTKPGHSKIPVCCKGYRPKPYTAHSCEPICEEKCINSNCTAPNTCTCYPGFIRDFGYNCVPTCPIGCLNGKCKPNSDQCICNLGYELDVITGQICIPKCDKGCPNGNCTEPGVCKCLPGFQKDGNGECNYYCEGGCKLNERCAGPNICKCQDGFIAKGDTCEPLCEKPCSVGSVCTGPNTCTCTAGYTLDEAGVKCIPDCDKKCLNGKCIGPNICECNRGYVKDKKAWYKCLAHCPNGCINGVCSAPNFCICNPGFVKARGGSACVPRD